jgi:hypothetical protein
MENEQTGGGWNSDEVAFEGLTCEQIGRLSTSFLGYLRLLTPEAVKGMKNLSRATCSMLDEHVKALREVEKISKEGAIPLAEDYDMIGLLAICMAAIASNAKYDPRSLASISHSLMEALMDMIEKGGPPLDDETILIAARLQKDLPDIEDFSNVQIKMSLVPNEAINQVIGKLRAPKEDKGNG